MDTTEHSPADAWGGADVLVASLGAEERVVPELRPHGAGIALSAPRVEVERLAEPGYASDKHVNLVDVHPSGKLIAAAGAGVLEILYAQDGQRFVGFPAPASALAARFSPDGSLLLVGGTDARAHAFDVRTGEHRGATPAMEDFCDEVAWLGRSTSFVMASQSGEVWVVDATTMTVTDELLEADFDYGSAPLGGLAASPDGARVFMSCGPKLGAFDVASGTVVWRVENALESGGRLAVSPRGDGLLMAGTDGVAMLDAPSGRIRARYQFPCAEGVTWPEERASGIFDKLAGYDDGPTQLAWSPRPRFSPVGDLAAIQDHVGNLCLIDAATGALRVTPRALGRAWIEDLAWFSDGDHLLLGASDNTISIWNVRSMTRVLACEGIGTLPTDDEPY